MLAGVLSRGRGDHPAVVRACPRGCVIDLGPGVDSLERPREILGDDSHGVAGFLEGQGGAEADYAGSVSKGAHPMSVLE